MMYLQHRNHMSDGTYPWPGCQFCQAFIVEPARREMRGEARLTGVSFVMFPEDDETLSDAA